MRWGGLEDWARDAGRVRAAESAAIQQALEGSHVAGACILCGSGRGFDSGANGMADGLREGLGCRGCGCNARQRAAAQVLLDALGSLPARATVRSTEQASRLHLALRRRTRLVGSEYLRSGWQRLRLTGWLWRQGAFELARHGDATALADPDARFDGVLSLDVLEHIPQPDLALREFARVLRPGGTLVLTVPFYEMQAGNRRIAELAGDGRVRHLGIPEFHGDPLSGGVPCFHHFGWQLLQDLRYAGFTQVDACRVQDPVHGIPQGQWVIHARR